MQSLFNRWALEPWNADLDSTSIMRKLSPKKPVVRQLQKSHSLKQVPTLQVLSSKMPFFMPTC